MVEYCRFPNTVGTKKLIFLEHLLCARTEPHTISYNHGNPMNDSLLYHHLTSETEAYRV